MSYGYLHRGRIIEPDVATGGYIVEIPTLAPTRRMGPFPSLEPNLPNGQRVVLASLGTSRDELVIVGRVPGIAPTIGQIPGLQAALDGKADDAEITALDGRLDTAEATLVTLDGRLDTAEAGLVTLGGRLDTAEADIDALTAADISLDSRVDAIEGAANPFNSDQDLFGDLVRTVNRSQATNGAAITNGTIYLMRMFTRRALSITQIRMVTAVAGTVGTATAGLYTGASPGAMTLSGSAAISLTTLGRVTATISAASIAANSHIIVALLPLNYSTIPQLGGPPAVVHTSMLNPNTALATYLTKGSQTVLPSTINTGDGTWTITGTTLPWVALGGSFA